MEPPQLRFAFTTSTALAVLGVILAISDLADWGLAIVALMLMVTSAVSWWQGRPGMALRVEPVLQSGVAKVSPQ